MGQFSDSIRPDPTRSDRTRSDPQLLIIIILLLLLILLLLYIFLSPASTKPAGLKIVKLDILLPNKIGHYGGKNYVSGKVLLNATALPRWSDTESLW